ncbi:hypothetical protein [Massilia sp. TWP1-3-3]|uniref:hypothetical protein n=1 Tax=Massilia sp. TWP1-3-3 TaxID=2804573 RepID=UPI003CF59BAE
MLKLNRISLTQRAGIFATATGMMIVLFLHFPFDGYRNKELVVTRYAIESCPEPVDPRKDGIGAVVAEIDVVKRCPDQKEWQYLPFSQWESEAPVFRIFTKASTAAIALTFIGILGAIWVWLFRQFGIDKSTLQDR